MIGRIESFRVKLAIGTRFPARRSEHLPVRQELAEQVVSNPIDVSSTLGRFVHFKIFRWVRYFLLALDQLFLCVVAFADAGVRVASKIIIADGFDGEADEKENAGRQESSKEAVGSSDKVLPFRPP